MARYGARGGTAARGRADVRGARGLDGQLLPAGEAEARRPTAADPRGGARGERAGGRARGPTSRGGSAPRRTWTRSPSAVRPSRLRGAGSWTVSATGS